MEQRQLIRSIVRWLIFIITLIGIPVALLGYFKYGTICWIDPFFHVQNLVIHLANWELSSLPKNTMLLLLLTVGGLVIFTIVVGRAFCSWICPFGTILDGVGGLNKEERRHLPETIQERSLKYGILLGFLFSAAILGRYVFCDLCPAGCFYRVSGPLSFNYDWLVTIPLVFLFVVLIIAFFYDTRGWCKFLCPLGALIAVFDKLAFNRVKLPSNTCIECRKCESVCPMDIDLLNETRYRYLNDEIVKKTLEEHGIKKLPRFNKLPEDVQNILINRIKKANLNEVQSTECIRCYLCVDSCPVVLKALKKKKKEKEDNEKSKNVDETVIKDEKKDDEPKKEKKEIIEEKPAIKE